MIKRVSTVITLLLLVLKPEMTFSQNRTYASQIIDTLCSPEMHGRGYVNSGDHIASRFIEKEFRKAGIGPFYSSYFHRFQLTVNTIPGEVLVQFDEDQALIPGRDFLVNSSSGPVDLERREFLRISAEQLTAKRGVQKQLRKARKKEVVILPSPEKDNAELNQAIAEFEEKFTGRLIINPRSKLVWSASRSQRPYGTIEVLDSKLAELKEVITARVDARLLINYQSRNVLAMIEGHTYPDSFIFITAHYDHLGRMGQETFIPGANDNASGIAMMLDMAHYYSDSTPAYSIVFVGFSGEEAGLIGSYHLVHKLKSENMLGRIKFLINMDLMGSGQEGIMAVNGKVFTKQFDLMNQMNSDSLMPVIKSRGKAANSDHHFFTEEGVPGFFFYLMGPYQYYHEVDDNPENLILSESYDRSFTLIRRFIDALQAEE